MLTLQINGIPRQLTIDPRTPLLSVLTETLGLTGTKYSCGIGECGACTVLIDGRPGLSCGISVEEVVGKDIVTIEGLQGPLADTLRRAWIEHEVVQCGYCQPAQLLTAAALLEKKPKVTDADIDGEMSQVLCRCGTYQAIRQAIHSAAKELDHEK